MKTIDSREVHHALSDIVHERGEDYVYKADVRASGRYPDCKNVEHDENGELQPSCIVGTVLHRLGAPLEELHLAPTDAFDTFVQLKFADILELPLDASVGLATIQRAQDQGTSWGECLKIYTWVMDAFTQSSY